MKNLTPYETCNERVVEMMLGKAMCAYANWESNRMYLKSNIKQFGEVEAKSTMMANASEYEATIRCIDMLVRENLYTIQEEVKRRASEELGI